jgi:hypothetical protein
MRLMTNRLPTLPHKTVTLTWTFVHALLAAYVSWAESHLRANNIVPDWIQNALPLCERLAQALVLALICNDQVPFALPRANANQRLLRPQRLSIDAFRARLAALKVSLDMSEDTIDDLRARAAEDVSCGPRAKRNRIACALKPLRAAQGRTYTRARAIPQARPPPSLCHRDFNSCRRSAPLLRPSVLARLTKMYTPLDPASASSSSSRSTGKASSAPRGHACCDTRCLSRHSPRAFPCWPRRPAR